MSHLKTLIKENRLYELWDVDSNGCWIWKRRLNKGYGRINIANRYIGAHSLIYVLFKGLYDREKFEIDHTCGNKACVNPKHLEVVTHAENMRRMLLKRGFKVNTVDINRKHRTKEIAESVKIEVEMGRSIEEVQKIYGLPKEKIEKILQGKRWI